MARPRPSVRLIDDQALQVRRASDAAFLNETEYLVTLELLHIDSHGIRQISPPQRSPDLATRPRQC